MEMRYIWLLGQDLQKYFKLYYHQGAELKVNYLSKARVGPIHAHMRPYYLHIKKNSSTHLVRASPPNAQQGCIKLSTGSLH
jgi:hypothetical protein